MGRFREQIRSVLNARTYLLAAVLVLVLLWVGIPGGPRRGGHPLVKAAPGGSKAAPAPAAAAPTVRRVDYESIEPGWGPDPFARRFPGGN